jgi:hypothetical protein
MPQVTEATRWAPPGSNNPDKTTAAAAAHRLSSSTAAPPRRAPVTPSPDSRCGTAVRHRPSAAAVLGQRKWRSRKSSLARRVCPSYIGPVASVCCTPASEGTPLSEGTTTDPTPAHPPRPSLHNNTTTIISTPAAIISTPAGGPALASCRV